MQPPSVDVLARQLADTGLPHPLLVDVARAAIAEGDATTARQRAEALAATMLQPVINATGVILHTNLGRAPTVPFPPSPTPRYSNVEMDLTTGRRGSRQAHAASLLARACGAPAALIVNNGAAAVLLVLAAVADGRDVIVSRGELVEIGGGFRIPEVLAASGARLIEVGTTNRSRLTDYRAAVSDRTAAILKVHQSNYRIVGFTEAVSVPALRDLGVPVVADVGSGLLDAACAWLPGGPPAWLRSEPAVRQTLQAGAALVTFSGDKLLGGPQAGIIAGDADLVARCSRHPLARALRPGALILAALQDTALRYLSGEAGTLPVWAMAARSVASLRQRAEALGVGAVVEVTSVMGGGALPGGDIPSVGIRLPGDHRAALREAAVPVIARVHDDATYCDLRTVDPADDSQLAAALARAVAGATRVAG